MSENELQEQKEKTQAEIEFDELFEKAKERATDPELILESVDDVVEPEVWEQKIKNPDKESALTSEEIWQLALTTALAINEAERLIVMQKNLDQITNEAVAIRNKAQVEKEVLDKIDELKNIRMTATANGQIAEESNDVSENQNEFDAQLQRLRMGIEVVINMIKKFINATEKNGDEVDEEEIKYFLQNLATVSEAGNNYLNSISKLGKSGEMVFEVTINKEKVKEDVKKTSQTDFFIDLQARAKELREKRAS